MKMIILAPLMLFALSSVSSHPHLYNPYYQFFRYSTPYYNSFGTYASRIPTYSSFAPSFFHDSALSAYLSTPDFLPTLNVLAEVPYAINSRFTVVPMLVVSKDNMKMVSNAHIMSVSKQKPEMTVKNDKNQLLQCTPAVKIVLERPITVYSLKSSILFPSEVQIVHEGFRIPIHVGAVIAPINRDTYVSLDTPIAVSVVYAVPTRPITVDYVNRVDVIDVPDNQAVIVESAPLAPTPNVTVIDFPDKEASPVLLETDDELGDRTEPVFLAPAGIVQSTQPITHVQPFTNSKESAVLIALREEALKRKKI